MHPYNYDNLNDSQYCANACEPNDDCDDVNSEEFGNNQQVDVEFGNNLIAAPPVVRAFYLFYFFLVVRAKERLFPHKFSNAILVKLDSFYRVIWHWSQYFLQFLLNWE